MRAIFGLALLAAGLALVSCNTVKGMGKDVSSAGEAVSQAADKAKK